MTIFAVLLPEPSPAFVGKIATVYPDNFYKVTDTQWLVSASGTAVDVARNLGIADGVPTSGIVFATSGYFGRSAPIVWDWIKAKLESPASLGSAGQQSGTGSTS